MRSHGRHQKNQGHWKQHQQDNDPWRPPGSANGHDRYAQSASSEAPYPHPRDEYDMMDARGGGGGWGASSSQEAWQPRYEANYSSVYHEQPAPSSWSAAPQAPFVPRAAPPDWVSEDYNQNQNHKGGRQHSMGRHLDQQAVGWNRDQRRDKSAQKRQSDNGWEKRRDNGWGDRAQATVLNSEPVVEDRSWEPAPSWQASNSAETSRSQTSQRSDSLTKKNPKGGKKTYNSSKQKRDWRTDDDLNNWQKRGSRSYEGGTTNTPSKKTERSDSRSPSPGSYESRYGIRRSRSRSRSPDSKRRRRDHSEQSKPASSPQRPAAARHQQQSPPAARNSGKGNWDARLSKGKSPSSHRGRDSDQGLSIRRPSFSSISSRSSDRSRSRSPMNISRPVHRLPTASNTPNTAIATNNGNHANIGYDAPHSQRNGKNHQGNTRNKRNNVSRKNGNKHASFESMPPPLSFPTSLPPRPSFGAMADKVRDSGWPQKPPSKANSSLNKFFEIDDEDIAIEDPEGPEGPPPPSERTGRPPLPQRPFADANDQSFDKPVGSAHLPPTPPNSSQHDMDVQEATQVLDMAPGPSDTFYSMPPSPSEKRRASSSFDGDGPVANVSASMQAVDIEVSAPPSARQKDLYSILQQVGEGTFGKVYKALNTATGVHVALKRIRMEAERDGFPVTAMREIKLLQSLRHDNIVRLYEMMVSSGSVYMVFEYSDHDLTGILSQSQFPFTDAHLKSLCHQMLRGLAYLHQKGVIHRDIKGSNILVNNRGELKLADFGLARFYQKRRRADYTNRVITLWYRPPELLFGATVYGPEVDMWSAGCIMLELYTKKPVFQGNDEIHQLDMIYKLIGTPTPERWPGIVDLPWYELVKPKDSVANHFRDLFQKWMSPAALDLAEQLLAYDPTLRIPATQAMETRYFTSEEPQAELPVGLATLEGEWHELETKRERAKKRKKE